jgi:hypothetical protein
VLPSAGPELPLDGKELPREGKKLPLDGGELPHGGPALPRGGPVLPRDRFLFTAEDAAVSRPFHSLSATDQRQTIPERLPPTVSDHQPIKEFQIRPNSLENFEQKRKKIDHQSSPKSHQVESEASTADRQNIADESQLHARFSTSDITSSFQFTSRSGTLPDRNSFLPPSVRHKSFTTLRRQPDLEVIQLQQESNLDNSRPGLIRKRLILEPNEDPDTGIFIGNGGNKSVVSKFTELNSPLSENYLETTESGNYKLKQSEGRKEEELEKIPGVSSFPSFPILNSNQFHNSIPSVVRTDDKEAADVVSDNAVKTDATVIPISVAADWQLRAPDVAAEISLWNTGTPANDNTMESSARTAPVRGKEDLPLITVKPRGPAKGFFNRDKLQQFPFFNRLDKC